MIAAVLVSPIWSVTAGALAVAGLWWYWSILGDARVPLSRRRVRRTTTMLLLIAIPIMVVAMSFIDRQAHPREFVIAWTLVLVLMLLIILGAGLDALNSVRLRAKELDREIADAAKELKKAMDSRQREESDRKDDER